jgi:hypothetical protein
MTEFWMLTWPIAGRTAEVAKLAEAMGWNGLRSPTRSASPPRRSYRCRSVPRRRRGSGSAPRHEPGDARSGRAASAFNTLQQESGGRMCSGSGAATRRSRTRQGARARLGARAIRDPAAAVLRGEVVERDGFPSRLHALAPPELPKVPVDIAGTGKRVIGLATRQADGLTIAVGANPERITATVREAETALRGPVDRAANSRQRVHQRRRERPDSRSRARPCAAAAR